MHPVVSNQTRLDLILASEVGSLHPVSFTWCCGQVGLQAGFSSFFFYNVLRSTAELPIECRIPTYCPLCLLSSNILQACGTLVKTEELTLGNNGTSDLIPFFQLSPFLCVLPRQAAALLVCASFSFCSALVTVTLLENTGQGLCAQSL